jgi:hypothetical protein
MSLTKSEMVRWSGTFCVEIVVAWDDDHGLSSRKSHDALNRLLGLSLPDVASANQHVEGISQDRDLIQSALFQVEICNRDCSHVFGLI